ncbi:MAG TPA: hypothetical protein VIJ11_02245, partial [Galbitalea sp.]
DSRRDPDDQGRLLGFIERLWPDRYEILWLTEPPRWGYVGSLKLALAAFDDTVAFAGSKSLFRDETRKARRRLRPWVR